MRLLSIALQTLLLALVPLVPLVPLHIVEAAPACNPGETLYTDPGANPGLFSAQPGAASACATTPDSVGNSSARFFDASDNLIRSVNILPSGTVQDANDSLWGSGTAHTTCDDFFSKLSLPCIGRAIASGVGWFFIYVFGWLLGLAASIFNYVLHYAVVNFNGTVYAWVAPGVEAAWIAFRDIANIVIIGIFTFVAIEMILGTQAFGGKKMVARVLIIAILINFSLLFTRVIIGTANFLTEKFYQAVQVTFVPAGGTAAVSSTISTATNPLSAGISGRFAQMMGVGGTLKTDSNLLWDMANNPQQGPWIALVHGIASGIIFFGAALVLLYAAFHMISRAVLLIFLAMTSSIAFATYLLPKSFVGDYGWSAWWNSLLKASAFGPILLIFLWATIKVGEEIMKHTGTTGMGTLISKPADGGALAALFGYVLILGMLYASVRIASAFSDGIAGFSMAKMLPGIGLGLGGIAAGILGRNTVGWGASWARGRLRDRYNDPNQPQRRTGIRGVANRAALRAARRLGTTTFNPLQTKAAGMVASSLGIPKTLMGKKPGEGGFEGVMERKARTAGAIARDIGPTDTQRGTLLQQHAQQTRNMEQTLEQQRTQLAQLRQTVVEAARQNQPDRANAERELHEAREASAREERNRAAAERERADELHYTANEAQRNEVQRRHAESMAQETERIQRAQEAVSQREQRVSALDETAHAQAELAPQVAALNRAVQESTRTLAEHAHRDPVWEAETALGESLLWDPRAAGYVAGAMRNHDRNENLRRLARMVNAEQPPAQQQQPQQDAGRRQ